jgi:hypothetical protein
MGPLLDMPCRVEAGPCFFIRHTLDSFPLILHTIPVAPLFRRFQTGAGEHGNRTKGALYAVHDLDHSATHLEAVIRPVGVLESVPGATRKDTADQLSIPSQTALSRRRHVAFHAPTASSMSLQ